MTGKMANRRLTLLQLWVLTIAIPNQAWAIEVTPSPITSPVANLNPVVKSEPKVLPPLSPKASPKVSPKVSPKTLTVQRFEIVGSTVFQPWELANVTQPFEEQVLSIEGLQKAADAVDRKSVV